MQWVRWTMMAVAGVLPSLALAEAAPVEDAAPLRVTFSVRQAEEGNRNVIVVGDEDSRDQKAQMDTARGTLQALVKKVKQEKGSYLGVSASAPSAVLRKQLGLPVGMGLVVEFVVPDSPAAKAGVQQYDVLQKLDDQLLVNQEQFAILVRMRKPGEEVKLTVFREGKPQALTAKLAEHDLEPLAESGDGDREWMEFHRALPGPNPRSMPPGVSKFSKEWRANIFPNPGEASSSVTWLEGDRSYSVSTDSDGHKTYVVKDKDGKSLFTGPIDTPDQREKLTPDLKEKLEQLEHRAQATFNGGSVKAGAGANADKEKTGDAK
ncbi:MAG TPA: PDZ domain-containing protein [Tepidisphaeraceae bacterium]|jgi:hypothetical protein|nr:PDZ domain-containing protein [Tepidisphaeraceae bacterium]